jgi:hypothetical protein
MKSTAQTRFTAVDAARGCRGRCGSRRITHGYFRSLPGMVADLWI